MKKVFIGAVAVVIVVIFSSLAYPQMRVSEDIVIPERCLDEMKSVVDASDFGPVSNTELSKKFPFRKPGYEQNDWIIGMTAFGHNPILLARSTRSDAQVGTKIFGLLLKLERQVDSRHRLVTLQYRPISSDCSGLRDSLLDLLVEQRQFGKYKTSYSW